MRISTLLLCAWIVWAQGSIETGSTRYEPLESWTYKDSCEERVAAFTAKKPWFYTRFVCLPDTVNPNR